MRNSKIRVLELSLLVFLAIMFAWGTALERQQQALSNAVIRLHVVANSDENADQTVKLAVRDAVLAESDQILTNASSREEALNVLCEHLDQLNTAAAQTLQEYHVDQPVQVTVQRELFGTRYYDSFALPGGYYDTLRVVIGAGAGHNWWCVVYPQICIAATTEDRHTVAVMGGLDAEQVEMIEGTTPEYRFKFRSVELLEDMLGWFRGGRSGIPESR